jgi:hypothetical protein|tara:strand:- start:505 stop:717 length:213 start_codon:yes stop_codon:yes gene_type:complete
MDDIYYESSAISYKTINIFEAMYNCKRDEIVATIRINIKEKYNIDIITNGSESTNTPCLTPSNNPQPNTD